MRLSIRACLQMNIERSGITALIAEYGRITFNVCVLVSRAIDY